MSEETASGTGASPSRPTMTVPSVRPPAVIRNASAAPSGQPGRGAPPAPSARAADHGTGTGTGPDPATAGSVKGAVSRAARRASAPLSSRCRTWTGRGSAADFPLSASSRIAHQSASRGTRSWPAMAATRSSSSCPASRSDASARKAGAPRPSQTVSSRSVRRATGARSSAARRPRRRASASGWAGGALQSSTGRRAQTVLRPVR